MKTIFLFFVMVASVPLAKAGPEIGKRGPLILKEIVSQPWAVAWKSSTLKKVRLVTEKPDLDLPLNLPPVWSAVISGPDGKTGHLIWDSTGEGKLVEFSLDDKLVIRSNSAKAITGVPNLQEFPIKDKEGKLVASGCVPTAAANVVTFWARKKYPQWLGDDGKTPKDLALRLRKQLKMKLYPDVDGFSPNRMALAGAYPGDLLKVLQGEAEAYKVPVEMGLGRFAFPLLKREIDASRPALLSCLVRVAHKPELSWPHEVAAVGYCEIDGVKLIGVKDNFFPTENEEAIRWIREDAFRSILILRPHKEIAGSDDGQ